MRSRLLSMRPAPQTGIDPYTHQPVQSMTAPQPGDVATQSLAKPIAENQVPGPVFQAAINTATDPQQKLRIAASQLFPKLPLNQAMARLRFGNDGRMVAVDDGGNPYYVEPQKILNPTGGGNIFSVNPYGSTSLADQIRTNALTASNVTKAAGAATPGAVQGTIEGIPMAANRLTLGAAMPLTAATTLATHAARQTIANRLDPAAAADRPADVSWPMVGAAAENALMVPGMRFLPWLLKGAPVTAPLAKQAPYVAGRAPWSGQEISAPKPNVGALGPEVYPGGRVTVGPEGTAVVQPPSSAPGVQLNPMGDAAAASGPYAATKPAEIASIPTSMPKSSLKPILSQADADARADQIIRHFAAKGPTAPDQRELVPDSTGTLSQITGNAGLASLERVVRNLPEAANQFNAVDAAQKTAQRDLLAKLVGTPETLQAKIAARDAATSQLRDEAFTPGNTNPTSPQAAIDELNSVLNGPEGKRPGVEGPLTLLRNRFYQGNDPASGVLETDPERLYGVRKAITDSLSPLARGTPSDARTAASSLQPVLQRLDEAIEAGAPGYRAYMRAFNQQSGPINAMQWFQNRNLTDALGDTTLAKVDQAVKALQAENALPGARAAKSVPQDQLSQLLNLRDDLRRVANTGKGRALGSNTVQNLAGSSALNKLTGPVTGIGARVGATLGGGLGGYLAEQGVEAGIRSVTKNSEGMVRDALVRRLLNENNLGVRSLQTGAP